jgi:hypothetical protein
MPSQPPANIYQIVVKGELDPSWSDWLDGFKIAREVTPTGTCTTLLAGAIADQASLRGLLNRLWDLNLEIVALNQVSEE